MKAGVPAILVPDEQAWLALGADPAAAGLDPVLDAGRARRMVVAETLPEQLGQALRDRVAELPSGIAPEWRAAPGWAGRPAAELLGQDAGQGGGHGGHEGHAEHGEHGGHGGHGDHGGHGHGDHGDHGGHGEHGGHGGHGDHGGHGGHGEHGGHGGHGDMMEITGEPSADGLVMEPIELSLGPLGTPLPTGLVVDVTLDGDVVAECRVRATLRNTAPAGTAPPPPADLLAPVAWGQAVAAAAEEHSGAAVPPAERWLRLAALELERAASHLAWLRAFGRLLGWPPLVDAAGRAIAPLLAVRGRLPVDSAASEPAREGDALAPLFDATGAAAAEVLRHCRGRRLAARTAGRGVCAAGPSLPGPAGRAAGGGSDLRAQDPLYAQLGFAAVGSADGDARARALVRAEEAVASIALARGALDRFSGGAATGPERPEVGVEGPRGPLRARRHDAGWELAAPGEDAVREAAGAAAVGLEWASALVVLASFDLSPWSVGP